MTQEEYLKMVVGGAAWTLDHPGPQGPETVILQRGASYTADTPEEAEIDKRFGWKVIGSTAELAEKLGV